MDIKFYFSQTRITLKERTRLKSLINELFCEEGFELISLTYIFCSDKYLLKLNQQYLKHDYYTDIITFDLSTIPQKKQGEIYISVDRVRENALNFKIPLHIELLRVIFHGALHLCGYKDKSDNEIKMMRSAEDKLLKSFFKERFT